MSTPSIPLCIMKKWLYLHNLDLKEAKNPSPPPKTPHTLKIPPKTLTIKFCKRLADMIGKHHYVSSCIELTDDIIQKQNKARVGLIMEP